MIPPGLLEDSKKTLSTDEKNQLVEQLKTEEIVLTRKNVKRVDMDIAAIMKI